MAQDPNRVRFALQCMVGSHRLPMCRPSRVGSTHLHPGLLRSGGDGSPHMHLQDKETQSTDIQMVLIEVRRALERPLARG